MSQRTIAARAAETERKRNELIEDELRKKRNLVFEGINDKLDQFREIAEVMQESGVEITEFEEEMQLWWGAHSHVTQMTHLGVYENAAQLAQRRENEKRQYYQAATLLGICLE